MKFLATLLVCALLIGCSQNYEPRPSESFQLDALTTPPEPEAGEIADIHIWLREQDGEPVQLETYHERILHAVVISDDFQSFSHIHPDDYGELPQEAIEAAHFILPYSFPHAGEYLVALDFATPQGLGAKEFRLNVTGERPDEPTTDDSEPLQEAGGYEILLEAPSTLRAGEEATLQYTITRGGEPVTTLEPHLAAAMHVAVVRDDLQHFQHVHGEVSGHGSGAHGAPPAAFGPAVEAHLVFPASGTYHVFGEFRHRGGVTAAHHTLQVG